MLIEFLSLIILILILFYWYMTRFYTYWERKNIPCIPAKFPYGSLKKLINLKTTIGEQISEFYGEFDDCKFVGFYAPFTHFLLLRDPELIKTVLIKEFNNFHDSGFFIDKNNDPLFGYNPFIIKGLQEWKSFRGVHTPLHSGTKIKNAVPEMFKVVQQFIKFLSENINKPVNVSEVSNYFSADVVARCGYGIESNIFFESEESIIKRCAYNLSTDESSSKLVILSSVFFPFINKIFRSRAISKQLEQDFVQLGKTCLELREKSGIIKNDLIQLILTTNKKMLGENGKGMTDEEIAGHCFTLFLDGVLTASVVLTFALHELAVNRNIQNRLRDELQDTNLLQTDSTDFDQLLSNQYLDMVLSETLRLHTAVPALSRTCTKAVDLDGIRIEPGVKIIISNSGLHNDPKYFPNPRKFDPERFSKENRMSFNKFAFLPFGEGPRICLGSRFALTQVKLVLAAIVSKFQFKLDAGSPADITYGHSSLFLTVPEHDVKIRFSPI